MSVITISRQLGSRGGRIGEAVAGRLEYMFVDKKRMEKIFSDYGLISFGNVYEEKPGFWERHDSMHLDMADFLKKVLLAIAVFTWGTLFPMKPWTWKYWNLYMS